MESLAQNYLTFFITIRADKWFNNEFIKNKKNLDEVEDENQKIINYFDSTPLINYLIIINELGEKNKLHHHVIVSYRSILGYNKTMKDNLKYDFSTSLNYTDIKIDQLTTTKEYTNRLKYIFKEDFMFEEKKNKIIIYNKNLNPNFDLKFLQDFNFLTKTNYNHKYSNTYNLNGYPSEEKEYNEITLLNIIHFLFEYKKMILLNNNIYKKIDNTLISYKKITTIKEFIENFDNYYKSIFEEFQLQLKNLDIYNLKLKYTIKVKNIIEKENHLISKKKKFKFNLIEFSDGIYILSEDIFIPKKNIITKPDYLELIENSNIGTLKQYKKTYKHLLVPSIWLKSIQETLKEDEESEKLFYYFATLFNKKSDYLGKQRTMFVKGAPSTGKTTLLASIAYNFFGEDNIGNVTNSESFNLEDLLEKEIAILDEAEHINLNIGQLLKLTDKNNPQKIDRKYKSSAVLKNVILLILSNNDFKIKDPLVKEAFLKRVKKFEFKKELPTDIYLFNELQRTLKRDEINIIIYCNKKFFDKYIHQNFEIKKKIRNNTYEKIIKLIK